MSDASDAVNELNQQLERTDSLLSSITSKTKAIGGNIRGGGASQIANQTAPSGGGGSGSGGGSSSGFDLGAIPDFKDSSTRENRKTLLKSLAGSGIELAGGLASMLPTTQEAMNFDTLANRLRFYGNSAAMQNIGGAYAMQRAVANLGTPTSASDAAAAANQGAGQGLLPGLSNYNATSTFGGVMGGAALASNLTPGLGLQGGMAAMAGLNAARNVNMLRMIGVDVRNQQGQMNDLPDVIGQIYRMLKQSAGQEPTAQMIAVSAMSGNALDSILTQYFGNDSSLRQTVLSGLLQMANSGGASLRTSGTGAEVTRTGGTSAPVQSLAKRNVAEQNMLQQWSRATNEGFMGANRLLSDIYTGLGNVPGSKFGGTFNAAQAALVGMDTFGGARNGAGAMITDSILGAGGAGLNYLSGIPSLKGVGTATAVGAGAVLAGFGANEVGSNFNPNYSPGTNNANNSRLPSGTGAPVYTGNITINVTSPTGSDPWAFANQITSSMVNAARS
jgi:hypothetical protein